MGCLGKVKIKMNELETFFKGKKVLITGHTGFKGAWLTKILTMWGAKISAISLAPHTDPNLFDVLKLKDNIHHYLMDVTNYEEVKKIFDKEQPEIVIHLAAQAIVKVSYDDPLRTYFVNIIGSANILQAVNNCKSVKSAVMITSDKAYENKEWVYPYRETDRLGGIDPYSASKAAADIVNQSFIASFLNKKDSPLVAITRAGNVIGGGDWSPNRLIPDVVRAIYEDKKAVVTRNPQSIRPWQYVLEPLSGYLLLAKLLYEGNKAFVTSWNFGPNDENFIPVIELIKRGIDILGKGSYEIDENSNFHESNFLKLDISKAKTDLNWHPKLGIKETLEFTYNWYKNYYEKLESPVKYTEQQIDEYFSR